MLYKRFLLILCTLLILILLEKSNGQEDANKREPSINGDSTMTTSSLFDWITELPSEIIKEVSKLGSILARFDRNCHKIYTVLRLRDDMENILEELLQSNPEASEQFLKPRVIEKVSDIEWFDRGGKIRSIVRYNYLKNTNWITLISELRVKGKSFSWRLSERLPVELMHSLSSFLLNMYQIPFYDAITMVDHAALLPMFFILYISVAVFLHYLQRLNQWTLKYFNEHLANELDDKFLNSECNCGKGRIGRIPFWGRGPFSNRIQFVAWCVFTWTTGHRNEPRPSPTEMTATEGNACKQLIFSAPSTLNELNKSSSKVVAPPKGSGRKMSRFNIQRTRRRNRSIGRQFEREIAKQRNAPQRLRKAFNSFTDNSPNPMEDGIDAGRKNSFLNTNKWHDTLHLHSSDTSVNNSENEAVNIQYSKSDCKKPKEDFVGLISDPSNFDKVDCFSIKSEWSKSFQEASSSSESMSDFEESEISSLSSEIKECRDGAFKPLRWPRIVDSMLIPRTVGMLASAKARRRNNKNPNDSMLNVKMEMIGGQKRGREAISSDDSRNASINTSSSSLTDNLSRGSDIADKMKQTRAEKEINTTGNENEQENIGDDGANNKATGECVVPPVSSSWPRFDNSHLKEIDNKTVETVKTCVKGMESKDVE